MKSSALIGLLPLARLARLEHLEHPVGDQEPADDVMVARATAATARVVVNAEYSVPAETSAPTSVMPEMAFEPDINGVCSVGGTFEISSMPRNTASTKSVSAMIGSMSALPRARGHESWMHDLAVGGDEHR